MTRINCVPVEELSNAHLLAEYREITRISKLARPLESYGEYRLGEGHVKFFYNKGGYLRQRTADLYYECKHRNLQVKRKVYQAHEKSTILHPLNEGWMPTQEAMTINRRRIAERIAANPTKHVWKTLERKK